MAVIEKTKQQEMERVLQERFENLLMCLRGRELTSSAEGCKRGSWMYPDKLSYVDSFQLNLRISDFKGILSEFKLK